MKITPPNLPAQQEEAIALEEALALACAYEEAVEGYAFTGGNAAQQELSKAEVRMCRFARCCFSGARFENAWLQDAVLEGCDLSGAVFTDATLRRVCFRGCKLSGANFSGAFLEDVRFEGSVAQGAVFSEASFKNVLFEQSDLSGAGFGAIRKNSRFRLEGCCLERADFLHTSLAGQDLTACSIGGASFSGAQELRGAKVTMLQACELARLLGVIIE